MQTIERERWMPYPPSAIYAVLTDETKLARVVKRIHSLEVLERTAERGRILTTLDLPGGKILRTEGEVEGTPDQTLRFHTDQPFPLDITWQLTPQSQAGQPGTQVAYAVALDLSPVVAFWSKMVLQGYLSAEMDGDLQRLEELVQATAERA